MQLEDAFRSQAKSSGGASVELHNDQPLSTEFMKQF